MLPKDYGLRCKIYPMPYADGFVIWLQGMMDAREWNQSDLARAMGKSRATVNKLVLGGRGIGADLCIELARVFNLPPEEVMRVAGILPPLPEKQQRLETLNYRLNHLTEEQQKQVFELIDFLSSKNK